MSSEAAAPTCRRLTFQEIMSLAPLPDKIENDKTVKQFISQRAAWCPEADVQIASEQAYVGPVRSNKNVAYGAHVYSQAGLAASRALAEIQNSQGGASRKKLGIHVSLPYSLYYFIWQLGVNRKIPRLGTIREFILLEVTAFMEGRSADRCRLFMVISRKLA